MHYLNLGCGYRYIKDWVNVDFTVTGPGVIGCNLSGSIPFEDASFDVVYHSHVLEHFSKENAKKFIKECYRVLKPGGLIRIVVPDLERIVKEYLSNLDKALTGNAQAQKNYEWIMLEMYDQVVRNESGGSMAKYWQQPVIPNEQYVNERLGDEFIAFRKSFKKKEGSFEAIIINKMSLRERLASWILRDKDVQNYIKLGKFRSGGEIHQWMYDQYSLGKLLGDEQFKNIKKTDAFSSSMAGWDQNQWLDVEEGKVRKPDSLFMEAIK